MAGGRMRIVDVEWSLAWLGLAHGRSPTEPGVPAREVGSDGAPIILGEAKIRKATGTSRGDLTEIGAEIMRELVETFMMRTAAITIAGIELLHRIHKGQFDLGKLRLKDRTAPALWNAVLSARYSTERQRLASAVSSFAPQPSL
jgi:hypothetical protein